MGKVVNQVTGSIFGTESAPKMPNYAAAAEQTAAANQQAALNTANLNRVTQIGPTGSQTWSLRPGADPKNPQAGDYIVTTSLSPEQQKLYTTNVGTQQAMADAAAGNSGTVAGTGVGGAVDPTSYAARYTGDVSKTADQFSADRQAVADALYAQQTKYLGDQFGREDEALRTQLLNRGLEEGSAGYENALRDQERRQGEVYATAANNATTGSINAQKTMQDALLNAAQTQQNISSQGLTSELASRAAPLNELSSLLQGGQVSTPQFQAYGNASNYAGANYDNAAQNYYNSGLTSAGFNNTGNSSNMKQLGSLLATFGL